ncbi:MAG TPA: dCTP deaminase [Gammaproteobacteria bacterium]|nr:dCTP deaminase [Gammaproteobacteria bacterium]
MKLSDVHLQERLARGDLKIAPPVPKAHFGSFSVDLRLANQFRVFKRTQYPFIDLGSLEGSFSMSEEVMEEIEIDEGGAFYLHPGELALGVTVERITVPDDLVGWLDGRSSLARLGLMIHITAHTIDPGWDGRITLEFANIGRFPLALRPGMRICAVSFEPLSGPTSKPYRVKQGAKYWGQDSPLSSRIDKERE